MKAMPDREPSSPPSSPDPPGLGDIVKFKRSEMGPIVTIRRDETGAVVEKRAERKSTHLLVAFHLEGNWVYLWVLDREVEVAKRIPRVRHRMGARQ